MNNGQIQHTERGGSEQVEEDEKKEHEKMKGEEIEGRVGEDKEKKTAVFRALSVSASAMLQPPPVH
jgi:hypothetical protein